MIHVTFLLVVDNTEIVNGKKIILNAKGANKLKCLNKHIGRRSE